MTLSAAALCFMLFCGPSPMPLPERPAMATQLCQRGWRRRLKVSPKVPSGWIIRPEFLGLVGRTFWFTNTGVAVNAGGGIMVPDDKAYPSYAAPAWLNSNDLEEQS